jgi:hypothetical protein
MFVLQVQMVIGTAQNLDVSEESWDKAVEIVESIPELDAEKKHVDKTNGKKSLRLTNGSRWKIAAASRRGGRGLSGDDVNLDELREHQNWQAWAAVTKTTMARPNAQVFAFSNAGDEQSVVLNDLQAKGRAVAEQLVDLLARLVVAEAESIARDAANAGIDTSLGLFEWSAPDDVKCTCRRPAGSHAADCRLRDRRVRAQANPALGYGLVTEEALDSALATDPEEVYRTECLCQRVPSLAKTEWDVFPESDWLAAHDPLSEIAGGLAVGVEASYDLSHLAIGVAGRRADTLRHLEPVAYFAADTGKLIGRLKKLRDEQHPVAFVVDPSGPASYLIEPIERELEVEVVKPPGREVAAACGSVFVGVTSRDALARDVRLRVPDGPVGEALSAAARDCVWRNRGDAKVFDRRTAADAADCSPLMAVTMADYGFANAPRRSVPAAAFVGGQPVKARPSGPRVISFGG